MNDKNKKIQALMDKYDLKVESVFIPWSASRNTGEKSPSLNWKVTLKRGDKKILTTDYSAGCGHAPGYKQGKRTWDDEQLVKKECETGFACRHLWAMGDIQPDKKRPILPDSHDVIFSLLMDSEVLEYSGFEDCADTFGYNPDSRKDEQVYNACMKIALQFRQLGEMVISELRDAFQDY